MLKEKEYSMEEWNSIFPSINVVDKVKGFLMNYQIFNGIVKDESGKFFRCTAWQFQNNKPFVRVVRYNGT